jgi:hypothetical protein
MACLLASKAGTIWVRACFRKLYGERCWWPVSTNRPAPTVSGIPGSSATLVLGQVAPPSCWSGVKDIRIIQKLMGHRDVNNKKICTYVLNVFNCGPLGVCSTVDIV